MPVAQQLERTHAEITPDAPAMPTISRCVGLFVILPSTALLGVLGAIPPPRRWR